MRKLQRSVLRYRAEKLSGKTHKLFRVLWKDARKKKDETFVHGKPVKQKSAIRRVFESIFKG